MAAFSELELKAISWYTVENELVPQLSLYPLVTFTKQGKEETHNIHNVLGRFEASRKDIKKAQAKVRRQFKKTKPQTMSLF